MTFSNTCKALRDELCGCSGLCLAVMAAIQPLLVFPIISIIRICKTLLAGL